MERTYTTHHGGLRGSLVLAEGIETDDSAGSPDGKGSEYDDENSGEDMDISEEEEGKKDRGKKRNASSRESST